MLGWRSGRAFPKSRLLRVGPPGGRQWNKEALSPAPHPRVEPMCLGCTSAGHSQAVVWEDWNYEIAALLGIAPRKSLPDACDRKGREPLAKPEGAQRMGW